MADLRGRIEEHFIHPVLLGETIALFRPLAHEEAVIPLLDGALTDAATALEEGHVHLAAWMRQAEALWQRHGTGKMSISERLDYHSALANQVPPAPTRVVYTKSGSPLVSAIIRVDRALIDHKLYWMTAASEAEAHYLIAIFNSETFVRRIRHLQSRGHGPRDFDKVLFQVPIAQYDDSDPGHRAIANAGRMAERVALQIPLKDGLPFTTARRLIRRALHDEGTGPLIEGGVAACLDRRSPTRQAGKELAV